MSTLYEIQKDIELLLDKGFDYECIDYETGEILEDKAREKLTTLEVEETVKIENIALFLKNLDAEAQAIKSEEQALKIRRQAKENKYQWLKNYLSFCLQESGKVKFETAKCLLSFRKSEALEITNKEVLMIYAERMEKYLKYKEPDLDIAGIKKAVKAGEEIPGVNIVERQNLQIK